MGNTYSPPVQDDRTYEAAMAILRSRRRKQRPDTNPVDLGPLADRIPDGKGSSMSGSPSIAGMKEWLRQIGHSDDAINNLNMIHVAGTKGKESTCAFAESLLHAFGQRTGFPRKTGLYTSPYLVYTEERIRLDTLPIRRDLFAKYFFEIWDPLSKGQHLPRYLQLLFMMAIHTKIREGVDTAIIETHHGGEYDATNVIEYPVVTVVTPLGMDHAKQLSPTIRNIAWHKAGIFKPLAMAFSSVQDFEETVGVLENRAAEHKVLLRFVPADSPDVPRDSPRLMPDVQRANCSLALAAVRALLKAKCPSPLGSIQPEDIERGVEQFQWPGRFQHVSWGSNVPWFLDGAHNEMSVGKAAD
ncbi:tetrahydrofolylpolyglutamate synthase [Apiospora phragmitis]|uniref:Tetrahydrofolylpolyglutamate synthase n=1 Tax=Apiospora phragmitis TaxID=2905665 RepID=A0ABR1US19_9PEZI